MNRWMQSDRGYIEIGENGIPTGAIHPHTYHEAQGHVVKITYLNDGKTSAEVYTPRHILCYLPISGEIIGIKSGFSLMYEITKDIGVTLCLGDGINLEVNEVPEDFSLDKYKIDIVEKRIIKK